MCSRFWSLVLASVCLFLFSTQTAQAAPLAQEEPQIPMTLEEKQGCGCHSLEKESWEMSPHGQLDESGEPVAACATCHGEYVEGHPDEGMIPLATDSTACTTCHEQTAAEWEDTLHAEAGIQCISCHVSHTQELRVTSGEICQSCHRDSLQDPLHTAHWLGETSCTGCHVGNGEFHTQEGAASGDVETVLTAGARHDFVAVSGSNCLDCHGKDVTSLDGPSQSTFAARNELMQTANQVPVLRSELANAQQVNRALGFWQPVSLGLGIGIGGILGIIFILIAVRLARREQGDEQ